MRKVFILTAALLACVCLKAQPVLYGLTPYQGDGYVGTISRIDVGGNSLQTVYKFQDQGSLPNGDPMQATNGKFYGMTSKGGQFNYGVLFSYDPSTDEYTNLIHFDYYSKGALPNGSLIQASDGKLYGMTLSGGLGYGIIFSYDFSTTTFSKLKEFDLTNGAYPYGNLLQASDGKLYGLTSNGGQNGEGNIFSYDILTNTYTSREDFNNTNGGRPQGTLIQTLDGKLYGMTEYGGQNNIGVIFSYDPLTDTYSKLEDFDNANGSRPRGSLIQASNGNLYGMTMAGGQFGHGVIFSYLASTDTYTKLKDFDIATGIQPLGKFLQTSNGRLYGMTYRGGENDDGVIFSYDPLNNTYTKLKDFFITITGNRPRGSLIQGSNTKLYGFTSEGSHLLSGTFFSFDLSNQVFSRKVAFGYFAGYYASGTMIKAGTKLYGMTSNGGQYNRGTIFSYDPLINNFRKIKEFDFDIVNGSTPSGSLMQATNGKLYGMTPKGGEYGTGTIFSYEPSTDNFTKLRDFFDAIGRAPQGSLIQAVNGKLYGMTTAGGQNGVGVIFSFDISTETYTKLKDFDNFDGAYPYGNLLQASDGKLYGLTSYGGQNAVGVIFSFDISTNTYTKLKNFDNVNGSSPFGTLVQASDGKLYGMTENGGQSDYGVLFSFDISTNTYFKLKDFDNTNGSFPHGALMQASDGKLYGMTSGGGQSNYGVVFSYDIPTNNYTKLQDFNGSNGGYPFFGSSLVEFSSCNGSLAVNIPDAYAINAGGNINTVYIGYQPASSITLSASPSGGNAPYSYNWSTSASQTTQQITVSPTVEGEHDFTVTVTDASGCTAQSTKTITADDIWSDKKKTKVYICHRDSRGTWTQLSILTGSVANHLAHGDYLGICNNNSSNSEILTRVANETGGQEIIQKGFKIYPNPATHFLDVQWKTKNTSQTSIRILNAEGKTVKTITTQGAVNQQRISLNGLAKGVYLLELRTSVDIHVSKFVVQ